MAQVTTEEPVFEAVIEWVSHVAEKREASLPQLLQHVRMPLLSAKFITDVIDQQVRNICFNLQNKGSP